MKSAINAVITVVMPTAVPVLMVSAVLRVVGSLSARKQITLKVRVVDVRTTTIGHNNSPLMDNNNKMKRCHIEKYANMIGMI